MKRSVLGMAVIGAVVALTGWLLAPAGAATWGSRADLGVFQPTAGETVPVQGGTTSSLNWSGYAVTGSGIHSVSSTFTVPTVGLVPPGFGAMWTGIGGYSTNDLIQAGIGAQSLPTLPLVGPQYYAWYEILPASETQLTNCSGDPSCTVNPGDVISVNIANGGGNTWNISITDSGHWSFAKSLSYASSESSAEWIYEAPTLVAAQTIVAPVSGVAHFGPTSSFNGGTTIAAGNPTLIDMGLGVGPEEATPSALASNGQSFNVCTYASSCPAPAS